MSPALRRTASSDPPVHLVSANGHNNARLAVPVSAFAAAHVRLSDLRLPVEESGRRGHVELVVGAAGSRYIADVVGLAAKPKDWPDSFCGAAHWIAGAVPHSWRRIDTEQRRIDRGQVKGKPLRVVRCGDLARSRGDSVAEIERRYEASAAPSAANPGYAKQDTTAARLLAAPESERILDVAGRYLSVAISDLRATAGDRWGVTSPDPWTLLRVNCGRQQVFACRRSADGVLGWRVWVPTDAIDVARRMAERLDGELGTFEYKGPPVNRSIVFTDRAIDEALRSAALVAASHVLTSALTRRRLSRQDRHNHDVYKRLLPRFPTA